MIVAAKQAEQRLIFKLLRQGGEPVGQRGLRGAHLLDNLQHPAQIEPFRRLHQIGAENRRNLGKGGGQVGVIQRGFRRGRGGLVIHKPRPKLRFQRRDNLRVAKRLAQKFVAPGGHGRRSVVLHHVRA